MDAERPFVVVEYNKQRLTFSVTPSLTFGHLISDCCLSWDVHQRSCTLVDPVSERIWPRSTKVLEAANATRGGEQLRVALVT